MYRQCTSEKAAAQQRKFEAAMLEMMKDRLFEEISISELCRYTGLSRKTFYRLYDAKADVIYAMIDHALLDAQVYVPDETVGPGGLHKFLGYWRSQKELLDMLKTNRISALLPQQAVQHVMQEAPEILRAFGADSEYGREKMIFYVTALFALVQEWHNQNFNRSIDELSAMMMQLMTTPPVKEPLDI